MIKKIVDISSEKTYPIFILDDDISNLHSKIVEYTSANKFLVVISEKVEKIYGKKLDFKNSFKFVLKDGENQKNFKNYKKIIDFAIKNKFERKDAIIAIGGGVVGDIAGFVAATYLRGIDFIQIPTTLLACVDSSVGGKVAIDTSFGKNLVGAFWQPKAVFCNLNFLDTLDDRQYKTGLGEIVKYAFIEKNCELNYNFYDFLTSNADKIIDRDKEILTQMISLSLDFKIFVVKKDEKENGLRKVLNFGHTFAHALEKITKYKKYTHGEAVSIGINYAFDLAFKRQMVDLSYKNQALELIKSLNLVYEIPKYNKKAVFEAMLSDKKVKDGKIIFILPSSKFSVSDVQIDRFEI